MKVAESLFRPIKTKRAFEEVWSLAENRRIDLRSAAYALAVQRVAEAIDQRGIFP